ncbi:tyrosine-type recombinase/integrase [Candidatus Methylomicrobium oryzae]|jgi:integrase|uniref:tyrosine-type recombinase/integrase n=1 Tax=Candidatus Methylomicrobium oryzae TaxID=2802053 RepID=UPI001920F696|nr:site-specific integrase [Methylomicrobium sp. RS1]MBL1264516.1 tyrosine-type recombinase/integrase [Methylomicrobium sp. RS1]
MAEKKINFTKAVLDALPLPDAGKRDTYHDLKTSGLQLRVTSNGVKTFSLFRRVKNGSPERVTLGRYPDMTPEQARNESVRLNGLLVQGINPNTDARALKTETTLQELFDEFLKHRRNKRGAFLSEVTKRSYRYDFALYLEKWGKRKLSQFKDTDFSKLHADIGKEHPTTANRVIAMASSLFGYAAERKLFKGANPAQGIKKFPETKRDRFLQSDELPAFFKALAEEPNDTFRDYFLIALLTGARRSNVLEMAWSQINLERAEWRIPTTKNGEPQTVTLSPEAVEILRNRQGCHAVWVFPGAGATGHIVEPKKAWARVLDRAGLDNLRIHDLRRTLGSWQAKTGASLAIVGKSLNHKSPSTTAIYARLDLDPVRESVERATGAMLAAGGLKASGEIIPINKRKQA